MISTNKAIAGLVFITLMNGFVSVNMFTNQSTFYSNEVDKLLIENDKLHNDLKFKNNRLNSVAENPVNLLSNVTFS